MTKNITWAPHIPLIGGGALACEKVFGTMPERVYSLPGFWANDSQYMNWLNNTLDKNIEYVPLDPADRTFKEKINIIIGCPPCSSLSGMNTGKTEAVKGPNCAKNEFMYIIAEQGIKCFDADVIIIENAPALSTNKGRHVADKLYDIAKANGYSLTVYATSTEFHGVPQHRMRTFALLWKSEVSPKMDWFRKDSLSFGDYLKTITTDLNNDIINPKIMDEPYAQFIKQKTGKSAREVCLESGLKSVFNYIHKNDLLEEAQTWFLETNNARGIKYSEHAIKKFSSGLGIWDASQRHYGEIMNAVISRNLADAVHPTEDRSLTIREGMHLMAIPENFELVGGLSNLNKICQNMPVCTAASMVEQAVKFINGELEFLDHDYVKQSNHNFTISDYSTGKILQREKPVVKSNADLEEFFN